MNENSTITLPEVPLHILLRRRRNELNLLQAEVAEALHVCSAAVTQWESGNRRMELSKLPRIAAALQLDARQLCVAALREFHPLFYATVFGDCATVPGNNRQAAA
jgi:transcriptional regulator with XRE-family HTH domain